MEEERSGPEEQQGVNRRWAGRQSHMKNSKVSTSGPQSTGEGLRQGWKSQQGSSRVSWDRVRMLVFSLKGMCSF